MHFRRREFEGVFELIAAKLQMPKPGSVPDNLVVHTSEPAIQARAHVWRIENHGVRHIYGSGWRAFYHFRPTYPEADICNVGDDFWWDRPPRTILPEDPRDLPLHWEKHMPSDHDDDDDGYFGLGEDYYY